MMFESIFELVGNEVAFLLCTLTGLVLGIAVAASHRVKAPVTKSFMMTLVMLPIILQALVLFMNSVRTGSNQNIDTNNVLGTGVAIAGALALIRFRSAPANGKDLAAVLLAMASGVAVGTGLIFAAMTFSGIACAIMVGLKFIPFPKKWEKSQNEKRMRITVPEDMDYETEFAAVFAEYTKNFSITRVQTSAMGSLFIVDYLIELKSGVSQKELIDKIRTMNANLPIICNLPKVSDNKEL
jgi:hypothetical protein